MTDYQALTQQIAVQEGINPNIFLAQIRQESNFNPNAVSSAGAEGIAQFMPGTAAGLGINPWDPAQALKGAADLMRSYVQKYGGYPQALAAYNAGPGSLSTSGETSGNPNWIQSLPAQTQDYISKIMSAAGGAVSSGTQLFNLPSCQQDSSAWYCGPITQNYGMWGVAGVSEKPGHAGIDIGIPVGTKVTALEPGTIVSATAQSWGGDVLEQVQMGGQTVYEQFLHLSELDVKPGQQINAGDLLGLSGGTSAGPIPTSSQYSTGAHVHFAEYSSGPSEQWGMSNTLDPSSLLSEAKGGHIAGGGSGNATMTYNTSNQSGGDCAQQGYIPIFQFSNIIPGIPGGTICLPLTVQQTQQGLIRTGLVIAGIIIVIVALWALIGRPKIGGSKITVVAPSGKEETTTESSEDEGPVPTEAEEGLL